MLLVDDHKAQAHDRREHRAAGAQHDVGLPLAHPAVLGRPLGGGQRRVPDGHAVAQARAQAPQELRRQGDLGDQHEAAHAAGARRGDGPQVHLRLARARHAVEQQAAPAGVQQAVDLGDRRRLVGVRLGRAVRARGGPVHRRRRPLLAALGRERQRPGLRHRPQGGQGGARPAAELGRGQGAAGLRQRAGHRAAARRQAGGQGIGHARHQPLAGAAGRGREHPLPRRVAPQRAAAARRQHEAQAGRPGGQVVARHPGRQLQQLRRQRRPLDHAGERDQPALVARRVAAHHHAEHPPGAERADHHRPGPRGAVERRRHRVVEDAVEAARRDQGQDLGGLRDPAPRARPWRRASRRPPGRWRCSPR